MMESQDLQKPVPDKVIPFLWHFIKPMKFGFALILLFGLAWPINEGLFPYFVKWIVNSINEHTGDRNNIWEAVKVPCLGLMGMWVTFEVCMRLQGIIQIWLFPKFRADIRENVFDYVRGQSHGYFANHFAGNIANKLGDLPRSSQTILEWSFFNFIPIACYVLLSTYLLWEVNPTFFYVTAVWLAAHIGITLAFTKSCNVLATIHSDAVATLSGKIVDTLSNITNVNLFARHDYEGEYVGRYQQDEIKKSMRASWQLELMKTLNGFTSLAFVGTVLYFLIHGWQQEWLTLGDFTLICMLVFGLMGLVWWMSFQLSVVYKEAGSIRSALELISQTYEVTDIPDAPPIKVQGGEIRFDDVTFGYHENKDLFENESIIIPAGQKVGLVGFSGSGKTTFVNLILRLFDVTGGRILIDGQDISMVAQESLRSQIAMIPQEPSLFHRSLMKNIRYGRLDATDEEVIAASKQAHCHEFIMRLKDGYQSLVGERGTKLSGGQRQRIAIARAILKNAPILILDEATSALDSVTEKLIQDSLKHLMQSRTCLVVAHRLSTLNDLDRILVFDKGHLVEDGTHAELLSQNGHYARIWHMQSGGFLPDHDVTPKLVEAPLNLKKKQSNLEAVQNPVSAESS